MKNNTDPNKFSGKLIFKGDFYESDFFRYQDDLKTKKFLTEKKYTIGKTHTAYRVINHWSKLDLLHDSRKKEGAWRKLSISDLIWIKVIAKLRQFGLSLQQIKQVKHYLFYSRKKRTRRVEEFEFHISYAMQKNPVVLAIFEDGFAQIALLQEYRLTIEMNGLLSHIHINFNDIVQEIFFKTDLTPEIPISLSLSNKEFSLLKEVRFGNYESIKVRFSDNKINLLELTKSPKTEKRIGKILRESKYQDIELQQLDGKIVQISQTIKKKP